MPNGVTADTVILLSHVTFCRTACSATNDQGRCHGPGCQIQQQQMQWRLSSPHPMPWRYDLRVSMCMTRGVMVRGAKSNCSRCHRTCHITSYATACDLRVGVCMTRACLHAGVMVRSAKFNNSRCHCTCLITSYATVCDLRVSLCMTRACMHAGVMVRGAKSNCSRCSGPCHFHILYSRL